MPVLVLNWFAPEEKASGVIIKIAMKTARKAIPSVRNAGSDRRL